jgi:8-oxo-dGTP pyrophosphatase MutT (NUDIX family)
MPNMDIKNVTSKYLILKEPYYWGPVTSVFADIIPEPQLVSNVHVVPFVGDDCVLLHTIESGWAMPGGTLQVAEKMEDTLQRELIEEIGAKINQYQLFASWDCKSSLEKPYRPHLPHPNFSIVLGWADVEIYTSPTSDGGVEQETTTDIVILPVDKAISHLKKNNKEHLAAIYSLAAEHRQAWKKSL